jgi:hypothetical protein
MADHSDRQGPAAPEAIGNQARPELPEGQPDDAQRHRHLRLLVAGAKVRAEVGETGKIEVHRERRESGDHRDQDKDSEIHCATKLRRARRLRTSAH